MKQIALAWIQYVQDYDEVPPNGWLITGNCSNYGGGGWASQLYPYIKSTGVYVCPSDTVATSAGGASMGISYALNDEAGQFTHAAGDCDATNSFAIEQPMSKWTSPTVTILLSEFRMPPGGFLPTSAVTSQETTADAWFSPESNGFLFSCLNGSVCSGSVAGGSDTGLFDGYPATSTGTPSAENMYPIGTWGSPGSAAPVPRHKTGANYAFGDGHVKFMAGTNVSIGFRALTPVSQAVHNSTAAGTAGTMISGGPVVATFSTM